MIYILRQLGVTFRRTFSIPLAIVHLSSIQFSSSVMSDSLQPYGLQHTRPPCLSPSPGICPSSRPLNQWCHPTISSSVLPFSSCLPSFTASGPFPMSWLFASGGRSIGASASLKWRVLPTRPNGLELTPTLPEPPLFTYRVEITTIASLENPRDDRAWWAAVYGFAQSRTRLKQLSSSSSFTVLNGPHTIYHLDAFENNKRTLLTMMLGEQAWAGSTVGAQRRLALLLWAHRVCRLELRIHTLTVRAGSIILMLQTKKLPIITREVGAATSIFMQDFWFPNPRRGLLCSPEIRLKYLHV